MRCAGLTAGLCGLIAALASAVVSAQTLKPAPVEERSPGNAPALQLQQQRASVAYREVQQAAYESKLAEQDVLNTQDAYDATRSRADALKVDLDKAIKARAAANAREAAVRKRYEDALQAGR